MSDYPENWDFEANAVLEGELVEIRAVQAKKFGSDEMEEKFVAEIATKEGTSYTVWLDSAVLKNAFQTEAKNRKAVGERFKDRESITIEYLGKRKGATYTYKDFKVEFEYAAPSLDGFDALAGSDYQGPTEDVAPTSTEAPASVTAEAPATDDIPF